MVAELLRLRLRLTGNLFRGRPGAVIGRIAGVLAAILLVVLVVGGTRLLAGTGTQFTARAIVGIGAFASLAALLLPIVAARRELMPARAFLGTRIPRPLLAPALPLLALLGPTLLVVPLAFAPLGAWPAADSGLVAGCGILLVLQTLLSLRIGAAVGDALRTRRRAGRWVRSISVILLVLAAVPPVAVILTRVFLLVPDRIPGPTRAGLLLTRPIESSSAIDVAAASPLGALWAAPAFGRLGEPDRGATAVLIGAATVVVLAAIWAVVVVLQLRPTRRESTTVVRPRVPGWFAGLPSSPAGAVTARSLIYWVRDPRYRTVLATVPVIPALMLLATWIGGVPFSAAVLIPLPVMTFVLTWSTTHNDVAYDHTAVWHEIATSTPGASDRIGRLVPPLLLGAVLVLVGAPLTAWGYGDWAILPSVLGVSIAVLLGSIGVSSGLSAQLPYAAPRPGDGAFRHPQIPGGSGGGAQALSIVLIGLVVLPALASSALWLLRVPGEWNWLALLAGLVIGAVTVVLGVVGGGRAFERRGPELLAFTMRH